MKKTTILIALLTLTLALSQSAYTAGEWADTFYQYRIPVVVDVEQAGWNIIPVDQITITDRVNRNEELQFDPMFFAYNQFKVATVDNDGKVTNPSLTAASCPPYKTRT